MTIEFEKNLKLIDVKNEVFFLKKKINSGNFGYLFSINDKDNKKIKNVIVKIGKKNDIFNERGFYLKYIKNSEDGILKLITHGTVSINKEKFIFLIFPKLHYTIKQFLNIIEDIDKKRFIYYTLINILHTLEFLHKYQIIHSDLKDDNIMIDKHTNQIYLIDFNTFQKKSINLSPKKNNFAGNIRFAPRNAHQGIYTEINDLESLLYNSIEWMYGKDILPWNTCNISKVNDKLHLDFIEIKKKFLMNLKNYISNKKLLKFNDKIFKLNFKNICYKNLQNIFE